MQGEGARQRGLCSGGPGSIMLLMQARRSNGGWLTAAAMLAGLVLRLVFVLHAPRLDGDGMIYGGIAKGLLRFGTYGFSPRGAGIEPTLIRLPGYPLFLLLCFRVFGLEHYRAVFLLQTAIDLGGCLLLAALTRRLFGRRAGAVALWIAVLCPFTAVYVSVPLAESLSLACFTLAFYSLERWRQQRQASGRGWNRWLWLLSFALAYALLLRPEQALLAAAVIPAMLWIAVRSPSAAGPGRRVFPVLAAALCVLLPLVPWTIRNWRTFHVFEPLAPRYATDPGEVPPLGFQRWYRTWAVDFISTENVYWNYDGAPIDVRDLPSRAFNSTTERQETEKLLQDYNQGLKPTPELDARFDAIARERIRSHPLRYYVVLPASRFLDMLLRPRTDLLPLPIEWWQPSEDRPGSALAILCGAINLAYVALGILGLLLWQRLGAPAVILWAMAGSIALRSALLLTIDNSEPRYTLQFFPVLIVGAAALLASRRSVMPISQVAILEDRSSSSCRS